MDELDEVFTEAKASWIKQENAKDEYGNIVNYLVDIIRDRDGLEDWQCGELLDDIFDVGPTEALERYNSNK